MDRPHFGRNQNCSVLCLCKTFVYFGDSLPIQLWMPCTVDCNAVTGSWQHSHELLQLLP